MTDEELKALVASNVQAIVAGIEERREWRKQFAQENAEWKAAIADTINHMSKGFEDQGNRLDELKEYVRIVAKLIATLGKESSARQDRTEKLFRETWKVTGSKFTETETQLQSFIDMVKQNVREHQDWREGWNMQMGGPS